MSVVTDHLTERGVAFETIPHEQAFTSIAEAAALGINADEVAKTLVLKTARGLALAVIPGSRRLDPRLAEEATGDRHAHLVSEQELEKAFPGFELGALPPLGSLLGAAVYVDPEVMAHETLVFAAGTQTESVRAKTADLFRDQQVTVLPLARHADE
jgi:prolyl-tRNA editing enzyme YbaK/EbsC (Cys-tRNA(Pro) deacylase)